MRQETINIYTFNELSEGAKENAREWFREGGTSDDFEFVIEDALRDFARWIYRQLDAENDYRNSDEYVDDCIVANDYEFYEGGRRA